MTGATQLPWDRIIGAAAASTLGVLSLCVILVGVLAWLFFGRSDDRIKLWVFGAILLAVIGLAISVLRESGGANHGQRPGGDPSGRPSATDDGASTSPGVLASATAPQSGANRVDLAGAWRDDPPDGFEFVISTNGNAFTFTQTMNGRPNGHGQGTIDGRKLAYSFTVPDDTGNCFAVIDPDGQGLTGFCQDAARRWNVRFVRKT